MSTESREFVQHRNDSYAAAAVGVARVERDVQDQVPNVGWCRCCDRMRDVNDKGICWACFLKLEGER